MFAAYAYPRVVVLDDGEKRLSKIDTPFSRAADESVWTVAIPYRSTFAGRHGDECRALRTQFVALARGAGTRWPVRFLIDVKLGSADDASNECPALAVELLCHEGTCRVYPISDHYQRNEHFRTFAILERVFPGRIFKSNPSWVERSFATYLGMVKSDSQSPPFVEATVPAGNDRPTVLIDAECLRVVVVTWLGDDFQWRLTGVREAGGATELVFEHSHANPNPNAYRYCELLPAQLPEYFLSDWNFGRLGAVAAQWYPGGSGRTSAHLPTGVFRLVRARRHRRVLYSTRPGVRHRQTPGN